MSGCLLLTACPDEPVARHPQSIFRRLGAHLRAIEPVGVFLREDEEAEPIVAEYHRRFRKVVAEPHVRAAARRNEDLARRRQLDDVAGRVDRAREQRQIRRGEGTCADHAHGLDPIATRDVSHRTLVSTPYSIARLHGMHERRQRPSNEQAPRRHPVDHRDRRHRDWTDLPDSSEPPQAADRVRRSVGDVRSDPRAVLAHAVHLLADAWRVERPIRATSRPSRLRRRRGDRLTGDGALERLLGPARRASRRRNDRREPLRCVGIRLRHHGAARARETLRLPERGLWHRVHRGAGRRRAARRHVAARALLCRRGDQRGELRARFRGAPGVAIGRPGTIRSFRDQSARPRAPRASDDSASPAARHFSDLRSRRQHPGHDLGALRPGQIPVGAPSSSDSRSRHSASAMPRRRRF